jgi:hypothetical protein
MQFDMIPNCIYREFGPWERSKASDLGLKKGDDDKKTINWYDKQVN